MQLQVAHLVHDSAANAASVDHDSIASPFTMSLLDLSRKLDGGQPLEAAATERTSVSSASREEYTKIGSESSDVHSQRQRAAESLGFSRHRRVDFVDIEEFHITDGGELTKDSDLGEVRIDTALGDPRID